MTDVFLLRLCGPSPMTATDRLRSDRMDTRRCNGELVLSAKTGNSADRIDFSEAAVHRCRRAAVPACRGP